ncbi:hypothetical protein KAR91_12165 [Candidatus Pacearchaeota archaeon]|nr:hypothetical protein [Candidatus Pacearchaeota archaeon]
MIRLSFTDEKMKNSPEAIEWLRRCEEKVNEELRVRLKDFSVYGACVFPSSVITAEQAKELRYEKEIEDRLKGEWNMTLCHRVAVRLGFGENAEDELKERLYRIAVRHDLKFEIVNRLSGFCHVDFTKRQPKSGSEPTEEGE